MNVVHDRLSHCSAAGSLTDDTPLLCLLLIVLEDESQWAEDKRHHKAKRTIRPSPRRHTQETLRSQWTNESR